MPARRSPRTTASALAGVILVAVTLAARHPAGWLWPGGRTLASIEATAPVWGSFPVRYADGATTTGPPVSAAAAVLLEVSTGTVLYARSEHQRRAPASTTKIVTALMAIESGRLKATVTVSRKAASVPGSSAGLSAGETFTLEEMLHALMLPSGNDAAVAIAEHLAGSSSAFAQWMTRRARELGAYDSRFENPHGLDSPGHYSTAYDLALFARTALQYPTFAAVVGRQAFTALSRQRTWHSTNRLLWSFEGATGVKTGTTGRAGSCLVAAASRSGTTLVSVVLDSSDRWADSARLLEYGFSAFAVVELARRDERVAEVPVRGARQPLTLVGGQRLAIVVPVRRVKDVRGVVRVDPLRLPVPPGARVGELVGYLGDSVLGSVPLLAQSGSPRPPWWQFWR